MSGVVSMSLGLVTAGLRAGPSSVCILLAKQDSFIPRETYGFQH